ncbi:1-acyl-sn-glycerol-3-phosphate acyltransferase [Candidatus Tokpelaia sp.]|nr:1-acyl-sn-glycerol-3-phosphate acyltransferase [Candidatus Tokpelaia sp.]
MLFIRSLLFKICLVLVTIIEMALFTPFYFFLPHKAAWIVPRSWARSLFWLQKYLVGLNYRVEGSENLPQGPYIVAAKHQSTWETLVLPLYIPDPSFILKRELLWIPFLGWFLAKMGMVPINRGAPLQALKILIAKGKEKAAQNRQIIIFPEGTRKEPGAAPAYKPGLFPIYAELGLPVVPVALNSGLYWPKKRFCLYPGTIKCRILPPIPPGLPRRDFMQKLEAVIENNCDILLAEAAAAPRPPYLPPVAAARLRAIEALRAPE